MWRSILTPSQGSLSLPQGEGGGERRGEKAWKYGFHLHAERNTCNSLLEKKILIYLTIRLRARLCSINDSRNSFVFNWKSTNLIGSPTVFYSLIKHNRARVALEGTIFLDSWLKVH